VHLAKRDGTLPIIFLCGAQNTVYWLLSLLTFSHFIEVVAAPNSNVMPVNMLRWMESGFVTEHIFGYKKQVHHLQALKESCRKMCSEFFVLGCYVLQQVDIYDF